MSGQESSDQKGGGNGLRRETASICRTNAFGPRRRCKCLGDCQVGARHQPAGNPTVVGRDRSANEILHPMTESGCSQRIQTFCALCVARCGAVGVVEAGRFTRLEPGPSRPTGQALCVKGRAAPELGYSRERLTHPLRRTRPKGDADPGWERISWDEALDLTAASIRRVAERDGPHAVALTLSSPSTTAIGDSSGFIQRLGNAFGTPTQPSRLMSAGGDAPLLPLYFRCRERRPRWDRGCNAGHRQ